MGLPEIVVYGNCRLCVGGRNQDRVWEEDRGRTLFVYLDPRQFETVPSDPDNSKVFLAKPFVVVPAHWRSSSWSVFTAQDRVWEDDRGRTLPSSQLSWDSRIETVSSKGTTPRVAAPGVLRRSRRVTILHRRCGMTTRQECRRATLSPNDHVWKKQGRCQTKRSQKNVKRT